jgi:hypothetical protein
MNNEKSRARWGSCRRAKRVASIVGVGEASETCSQVLQLLAASGRVVEYLARPHALIISTKYEVTTLTL